MRVGRGFPKVARLRRSSDFALLAQDRSGLHFSRPLLSISARPRGDTGAGIRVGFTTSRRQAPRAVARNMVKRVLREAVRLSGLPDRVAGLDVVLRLRSQLPPARARGWQLLKRDLRLQADGLVEQLGKRAS